MQAAAGMGVFGPRTIYCIALKDAPGCHEFLLQDDGKWVHVKETTEIGEPPLLLHLCIALNMHVQLSCTAAASFSANKSSAKGLVCYQRALTRFVVRILSGN